MVDSKEDFEVFDQPDIAESSNLSPRSLPSALVSSNQETADVLEAMVLQRKNTNLLKLLESHTGGSTPEVAVHPRPLTPLPSLTSLVEPPETKRNRQKKGKKTSEEGKVPPPKDLEPQKGAKITKGPQRRTTAKGLSIEMVSDRHTRVQFGT